MVQQKIVRVIVRELGAGLPKNISFWAGPVLRKKSKISTQLRCHNVTSAKILPRTDFCGPQALVKIPGHMFLAFYTDAQRQHISFLETTMVGSPGLNSIQRNWTFKTADGYLSSESYRQFTGALNYGEQEFQKVAAQFKARTPGYMLIDIQAARRAGISAIGRF